MNIFERAIRNKLRFSSSVGDITAEQVFDLPLTAKGEKPSLDVLARAVHSELKAMDEVSFVDEKPNPRKIELELQLDILKHVIESKKADRDAAAKRVENEERRKRLLAALANKQDAALANMSQEEIKAELDKLGA